MDIGEPADYRLRLCPSELAELPGTEISPEVCQIVQEAFDRHFTITNQAVRENLLELFAIGDGPPRIFEAYQATVRPMTATDQQINSGAESASETRRQITPLPVKRDDEADSPPMYEDVVGHDSIPQEAHQVGTCWLRPNSDVSASSSSPTSYFSAIGSRSSKTSVELPESPRYDPVQSDTQDQTKQRGPRHWIKSTLARTQHTATKTMDDCLACATEFAAKHLIVLTCPEKHKYCRWCFEKLVKSRCESESVFPPRCCQVEVPASLVVSNVSRSTKKMYAAQAKIASIAPDERWYCPHPRCLKAFNVKSAAISQKGARCPHCHNYICVSCKQQAHLRHDECGDGALKATLRTGKHKGWQTCYKCGEMVELTHGCRHITCRCKAEFCYVCSRRWPHCINSSDCAEKLVQIRREEASDDDRADQVQDELPILSSRANRPVVQAVRAGSGQFLADMTEEEQVAHAMQETLREAEEAEAKRVIEESELAAAAVAIVELMQERERAEHEERAQRRAARVERRFRYFDSQMRDIRTFQENLIAQRHLKEHSIEDSSRSGSERENDMQWLHRMHAERLAILAEDKALLMQDPGFSLHNYRLSARQPRRTAERGRSQMSTNNAVWQGVDHAKGQSQSQSSQTARQQGEGLSRSRYLERRIGALTAN